MKMRLLSVILLHGVCVLHLSALTVSAVSLSVTPDHKQFFSRTALAILSCDDDDEQRVDGWTVKRTRGGVTERCGAAEGLVLKNSKCQLKLHNPSDGAYFCESSSGQRSDEVNIIVSAGSLILKAPSSPVWTGSNVTLLCESRDGEPRKSYFYKDGNMIGSDLEGTLTLTNVQKSDEGLYSCSTEDHPHTHESRLTVRDPPTDPPPNVKAHPGTGTGPHPLALLSQPPSCQVWFLWFSWFWFEFCSFGGS
ncbi:uncharacterized protein LOC113010004 isoform X2 [Astatotilapia calliptera]|uniref:uncharacterized protein LOC113010004 isoform X2 n=1 Tax=Astatotilapia calliptera TaxID=8154 RepID=UPI000E42AE71|nr:uncharacterized protein LOC113010004 isoform X2 [Astatotilapia calliptera]